MKSLARNPLTLGLTCCFLLFACGRTDEVDDRPGRLVKAARQARAEGKTATSVRTILDETGADSSLDKLTLDESILLVTAVKSPAGSSWDDDSVFTWHLLRIDETLWVAPNKGMFCYSALRSPIPVPRSEIALALAGGTAAVDGVAVTWHTGQTGFEFQSGRRYLLLAEMCPEQTGGLPHNEFSVFHVDENDRISATVSSNLPFAQTLLALGSLEGVRTYLAERRLSYPVK